MAKIGQAQITVAKYSDGTSPVLYFAYSKSETEFIPDLSKFFYWSAQPFLFGGALMGYRKDGSVWKTDKEDVGKTRDDTYRYLWCKTNADGTPFLFTGDTGAKGDTGDTGNSITTTVEYLLSTSESLTEEQQAAQPTWVEEELVTWSYGKYIYKRLKKTVVETGVVTYTYKGRDTAVEDHFKAQLKFELSADRTTYIVDKRSSGTQLITLRIDQRYYDPTSYVFTKNGETFTPTQQTESVYTFSISVTEDPIVLEIKVVPYIDGTAIAGVSSSVIISPDNQTEYYQFNGLVSSVPTSTTGYLTGDSCFVSSANCIYVFNGTSWQTFASSALDDSIKMEILTKAEKTAFEYAVQHGLSVDYGYYDTIFAKYVKARNIGAETVTLTSYTDDEGNTQYGKVVGGDSTTLDSDGYLVNQGVYMDATGLARFTLAMLNNCNIKGGTIEVLSVKGELINDVLSTKQKSVVGEAYTVGTMASKNYYLGSQAKAKIKALLPATDTLYSYSGTYGGKSFSKVINYTGLNATDLQTGICRQIGTGSATSLDNKQVLVNNYYFLRTTDLCVSVDGVTWTAAVNPFPSKGSSEIVAYAVYEDYFYAFLCGPEAYHNYPIYRSIDAKTWTFVRNTQFVGTQDGTITGVDLYVTEGYVLAVLRLEDTSSSFYELYDLYNSGDLHWSIKNLNTIYSSPDCYRASKRPSEFSIYCSNKFSIKSELVTSTASYSYLAYGSGLSTLASDDYVYWGIGKGTTSSYLAFYKDADKIYYGTVYSSNTSIFPSSWATLTSLSSKSAFIVIKGTGAKWAFYDGTSLHVYYGTSLLATYTSYNVKGVLGDGTSNRLCFYTSDYKIYEIDSSLSWTYVGLNFLNSSDEVVAYESAMGDYIQSQACTLNNGSTALLNLPQTIPSDMDFYRQIPTLYDTTQMLLSINAVNIEAYTRFDTSTNTEVYVSAITEVPSRVDISPTSLRVDNVEKLNSAWYIKNKTSLTATVTPNAESAGVKTGDLEPKTGDATIGAITPYKVIKGGTVRADTLEADTVEADTINTSSLIGVYPIGAIYLSTSDTSPASFLGGTWEKLPEGYTLWTVQSGAGGTIPAGLPNIKGYHTTQGNDSTGGLATVNGAFSVRTLGNVDSGYSSASNFLTSVNFTASKGQIYTETAEDGTETEHYVTETASDDNGNIDYTQYKVYGKSNTVQPPSIKVYAWRRTN